MFFHLKLRAGGPYPSLAKPKPNNTVEHHVSTECWKEGVIVLSCPAAWQEARSEPQQPGAPLDFIGGYVCLKNNSRDVFYNVTETIRVTCNYL